jgi:hypothetical protein
MATANETVERLVNESSYVFEATVTQLNASNEPAVLPPEVIVAHGRRLHFTKGVKFR